jgi:pantoate--beta-alanine ligase
MFQLHKGSSLQRLISDHRAQGKSVGFVPTMGALHAGHLELVRTAKAENDFVVCSIFVNPTQFNNPEDLAKYPRTEEEDLRLLVSVGCDAVYTPSVEEMYPSPPDLAFDFGALETVMEGAFRPGHFNGVGIVVAKLFHMVQPDRAYFGQKDLQQTAIIKSLVRNLSFPITLRICPTVRESDGLAKSSRNVRLTPEERELAPAIYRILTSCRLSLEAGMDSKEAILAAELAFGHIPPFRLEYLQLVNANTLLPIDRLEEPGSNALCVAAYLRSVRLIDNLVF